jgi:hypothetical protein
MSLRLPPISQKNRPIGLVLFDGASISWAHIFSIRPEDMMYVHPTRSSIVQTFGGAWVDDWGEGIKEVRVSGHHGWNHGITVGEVMWANLRRMVLERFHNLRAARSRAGQNVDEVELILVDTLNLYSYVVYPENYSNQKTKTHPLLTKYTLHLKVLAPFSFGGVFGETLGGGMDVLFGN